MCNNLGACPGYLPFSNYCCQVCNLLISLLIILCYMNIPHSRYYFYKHTEYLLLSILCFGKVDAHCLCWNMMLLLLYVLLVLVTSVYSSRYWFFFSPPRLLLEQFQSSRNSFSQLRFCIVNPLGHLIPDTHCSYCIVGMIWTFYLCVDMPNSKLSS